MGLAARAPGPERSSHNQMGPEPPGAGLRARVSPAGRPFPRPRTPQPGRWTDPTMRRGAGRRRGPVRAGPGGGGAFGRRSGSALYHSAPRLGAAGHGLIQEFFKTAAPFLLPLPSLPSLLFRSTLPEQDGRPVKCRTTPRVGRIGKTESAETKQKAVWH